MRTIFLLTISIQRQGVILQRKSALRCGNLLPALDLGIKKLLDSPALQTHQVIMMIAFIELEYRLAGLEIGSLEQSGLLELGQNPINSRQSDIFVHR